MQSILCKWKWIRNNGAGKWEKCEIIYEFDTDGEGATSRIVCEYEYMRD